MDESQLICEQKSRIFGLYIPCFGDDGDVTGRYKTRCLKILFRAKTHYLPLTASAEEGLVRKLKGGEVGKKKELPETHDCGMSACGSITSKENLLLKNLPLSECVSQDRAPGRIRYERER
jgi:hypothetical protein